MRIASKLYSLSFIARRMALLLIAFMTIASFGGSAPRTTVAQTEAGRSFVYVVSNPDGPNAILAYSRNRLTGELALIGSLQTGGSGRGRIVDFQIQLMVSKPGTD